MAYIMMINKPGSIMLFMIISINIVTIFTVTFLRNGRRTLELILYHQQHIKQNYLTESLLDYALAFTMENYQLITKQFKSDRRPMTIMVGDWPPPPLIASYTAQFFLKLNKNNSIKIDTILYNKDNMEAVNSYSCSLWYTVSLEGKSSRFLVKEWHGHPPSKGGINLAVRK